MADHKIGNNVVTDTVVVSPWKMSLFDRDSAMVITPNGLRCQSRPQNEWHGCRSTTGVKKGHRYYYEVTIADDGLCRVGWALEQATLKLGTDKFGFGFGGTGRKSTNNRYDLYGEAFGKMDVIGCMFDAVDWEVKFSKNGKDFGQAFKITDTMVRRGPFYPTVVLKNSEVSFNFGEEPFKYDLPSNYIGLCNVPDKLLAYNLVATSGKEAATRLPNAPQAIIIEPSIELAEQTHKQLVLFQKYLTTKWPRVKEMLLVGGTKVREQLQGLQEGVDIIVATPGRLEDLIESGHVSLTHCRFLVLDEVDGLLTSGYNDLIERIHKHIPKITSDGRRLQMIMCSATLHDFAVKKLANRLMHFPVWIDLKGEDTVPETVHHVVTLVNPVVDQRWRSYSRHIQTDGVHATDTIDLKHGKTKSTYSEAVKIMKAEYLLQAIEEHKMERCEWKLITLERYN